MNSSLQGSHRGRRRRQALLVGGVAVVAAVVFVLIWFQPQKLYIDDHVDEAAPVVVAGPSTTRAPSAESGPTTPETPPAATVVNGTVATGSFRSLEHQTTGRALVLLLPSGQRVLRFEDLDTSNGPDLRAILSSAPSTAGDKEFGDDYVELGKLKGNIGNQNYDIPSGVDLSRYSSAVMWCHRFKVDFGVAGLE
ncbi:MAG: DM13 domain-containing protein [Acidimicrobiales bacterium]